MIGHIFFSFNTVGYSM